MAKHKKCDNCFGKGKIIMVVREESGRLKSEERICPVCKGTGFKEVNASTNNDVLLG